MGFRATTLQLTLIISQHNNKHSPRHCLGRVKRIKLKRNHSQQTIDRSLFWRGEFCWMLWALQQKGPHIWDCRVTLVERDLKRSLVQPPAQSRVSHEVRPGCSGLDNQSVLTISKDGACIASPGNLLYCLTVLIVEKVFFITLWTAVLLSSVSVALPPVWCHTQIWWECALLPPPSHLKMLSRTGPG